jgi:hypothetical protein
MATVFNKGISILNIGGEMCKLYNNVKNEKELMNVFTLFEKLFKYQKNLAETKKSLFQAYLLDHEQRNKDSLKALDRLNKNHADLQNRELMRISDKTSNLDDTNKEYEIMVDAINSKIEEKTKEIREILLQKKEHEDSMIKINMESKILDEKYLKKTEALKKLENQHEEILEKEREANLNQVTNIEANRETNFIKCLDDLSKEGITIEDKDKKDFRLAFNNFSKNFHLYKLFREDIRKRANDIKSEFEQLKEQLSLFNDNIQNFRVISNSGNLKNKIWEMITNKYIIDHPDENPEIGEIECLKKILFEQLDLIDDDKDRDVTDLKKTLDLIRKNVRGCSELISKMEVDSKYNEQFVDKIIGRFKQRIKDKKKEKEELEKHSDQNADKIKKIESQIDELENQIDLYRDNESEIKNILDTLDGVRMKVKEMYLKETVLGDLKTMINLITTNIIPNINIMRIEYGKNSS